MSWFGNSEPPAPAGPSPMDIVKQEIDMYSDLFSKYLLINTGDARTPRIWDSRTDPELRRMSKMCFKKCVLKMSGESDLTVGEMTCVDRCVSKYIEAQEKVGVVLKQAEETLAQQPGAPGVRAGAGAPAR